MPKPDVTKLGWFDRTIDGCIVDSIPAGDAPKFVKVVLPGTDGSIIPVWWTGFPALAVSDTVSVRYSPGNAAQYVISGTSGATVSSGGGGWPFDNVFTVSATNPGADFASIQDANDDAGVGSGDALALDAETFSEALTISKALAIVAAMLGQCVITDSTNSAPTMNLTATAISLAFIKIGHTGAGTTAGVVGNGSDGVKIFECILQKTAGAPTTAYGFWNYGAYDATIESCQFNVSSGGTNNWCIYVSDGTVRVLDCLVSAGGTGPRSVYNDGGIVTLEGGNFTGIVYNNSGTLILKGPTLNTGITIAGGTATGWYYDAGGNINFVGSSVVSGLDKAAVSKLWESDSGAVAAQTDAAGNFTINGSRWGAASAWAFVIKNTSGATANANDVGYINEAGEYKTTTTATANVNWCVVVAGGANNADIYVARRGRVSVNYTGTAPGAGNYLVTSTSSGLAQTQTTTRPEIFAVCLAAGSGGVVQALLLTERTPVLAVNATAIMGFNNVSGNKLSDRDFVATLNGAANNVAKTFVYNAPSSGHENNLDLRAACTEQAIYNTTRSQTAWISSCNVGTNTVTCTSDSDLSAWVNGDTVNIRSTVCNSAGAGGYYFGEFRFNATANKPALATALLCSLNASDTGATQGKAMIAHPYETFGGGKQKFSRSQVANITNTVGTYQLPIIDGLVCFSWTANTTSGQQTVFLDGWIVATP